MRANKTIGSDNAPVVTGISPSQGGTGGGTLIRITGSGFTGATVVSFASTPATSFIVVNDGEIVVLSPPGSGTADVTVTNPAGTSALTSADQFTYQTARLGGVRAPATVNQYAGILPYDKEEFGVYHPLLSWYGSRSINRLAAVQANAAGVVIDRMASDPAIGAATQLQDPTKLAEVLLPSMLQSSVSNSIAAAVGKVIQGTGAAPNRAAWKEILSDSALATYLKQAGAHAESGSSPQLAALYGFDSAPQAQDPMAVEHASASFFKWMSTHSPDSLNPLFLSTPPAWKTALSYVSPAGAAGSSANHGPASTAVLSPVGLINLYREYFYELDTFLGPPVGHVWVSPGGSVELYEASTRATTVTQTTELSTTETAKEESDTTNQDELSDAVKSDNKNDTKIGASANAGGSFLGIVHGDASASYSSDTSVSQSNEEAHKHSRTQSVHLSKEITRNYKTTFQTVTSTTDTTSRRYLLANNTTSLLNFELRRKLRLIGVQLQHLGTRLAWQAFVPSPASLLGVGEFLPAPQDSSALSIQPPPAWDPPKQVEAPLSVSFMLMPVLDTDTGSQGGRIGSPYRQSGASSDPFSLTHMDSYGNDLHVHSNTQYCAAPPGLGYTLTGVRVNKTDPDAWVITRIDNPDQGFFSVHCLYISHFTDQGTVNLDLALEWTPPDPSVDPTKTAHDAAYAAYQAQVAAAQLKDYINATRTLVKNASGIVPRPSADLRAEERDAIYRQLYQQLTTFNLADQYITAEYVRELFDVDSMLYYVEPDYYLPTAIGPTPGFGLGPNPSPGDPLGGSTLTSWPRRPASDYYLITEDSQPAPMGASLGWTIQLDGDERRNEFLNASWIKAVIPARPGKETEALAWLENEWVEGTAGLSNPYVPQPGDPANFHGTFGDVLAIMASELASQNADIANTLATEVAYESGFDPLADGIKLDPKQDFKKNAGPFEKFDFWLEVMPTDQVVAVVYDPSQHGA